MDTVMDVVSVVGVVAAGAFLFMTALPPKRDGSNQVEKFLPPLHGGYKPRVGENEPQNVKHPKPPPGPGASSQRRKHDEEGV